MGIASGFNLLKHLGEYDATCCAYDFYTTQCGEKWSERTTPRNNEVYNDKLNNLVVELRNICIIFKVNTFF